MEFHIGTRKCEICDIHKPLSNYTATDKRYHAYRYCSTCVDAELIKCKGCGIVQHKDNYNKEKSQYLGRKSKCTPCRTALKTEETYAREKKWRETNKAHFLAKCREHYDNNKEMYYAKNAKRRAAKLQATIKCDEYMEFLLQEIYSIAKERSEVTGVPHDVDHIIPLIHDDVCGLHTPYNLQVLTAEANRSKSNNWSIEEYNSL